VKYQGFIFTAAEAGENMAVLGEKQRHFVQMVVVLVVVKNNISFKVLLSLVCVYLFDPV
jgi:hypothetical protein